MLLQLPDKAIRFAASLNLFNMTNKRLIYSLFPVVCASIFLLYNCSGSGGKNDGAAKASDPLAQRVQRGEYLATHVTNCVDCHSQRDFNYFSGPLKQGTIGMGGFAFDQRFGIPGVVYARNITPDTATGIGKWSDAEIARAITQGISKNGDTLFPIMPYPHFNGMTKEDVYDIIAYLRTLKPVYNKVPDRQLMIPAGQTYPPFVKPAIDSNRKPSYEDKVAYGGYLVNSAACMDCHTPMEKGQFRMDQLFAGGFLFDMGAFKVNSANLTPDSSTGIGAWTEEMFLSRFTSRRDSASIYFNPGRNNTIMPWTLFSKMDDYDIKAIYAYLRTLKPVKNSVIKNPQ